MHKNRAFQFTVGAGSLAAVASVFTLFLYRSIGVAPAAAALTAVSIIVAFLAYLFGSWLDRIEQQRSDLEQSMRDAEFYLGEVASSAVAGEEWEVGLQASHIPTCWEMLDCTKTECPVFSKKNIRCWFIAGTYCRGQVQGGFAKKLHDCSECPVHQAAIDNHPIGQIHESFNNLLWVVNEKARLLSTMNAELREKYDELEALNVETKKMAETDLLTGLYNYGHFHEYLKRALAESKRFGRVLTLLLLDFDDFKQVNEIYGYQTGDELLKNMAEYLEKMAGSNRYIARYGNAEFVIVMKNVDGAEATGYARRLVKGAGKIVEGTDIPEDRLRLSIGIADYPDCASDAQSLVSAADAALLFAKNKAGDRFAYFCDLTGTEFETEDVGRLQNRLHGAGITTLTALARAVDAADQYGIEDRETIGSLAKGMARKLDMDADEADLLVLAASIHDIGKIGIPAEILSKTDKLSAAEVEIIRRHPEIGQDILREARQIQELVLAILYHHERWDGQGYPEGLEGKKIPLMARVVGIFDAYRAMRSNRPYRRALSQALAIEELRKGAGSQFDPELVELFIEQLEDGGQPGLREAG